MYSLMQKKFLAKKAGEDHVTLTMEEVDFHLAKVRDLDKKLCDFFDRLSDEEKTKVSKNIFGNE